MGGSRRAPRPSGSTRLAFGASRVELGGQDEVVLAQAADGVGDQLDADLAPGEVEVRVVSLGLGDLAGPVDERQSLCEVRERVRLRQPLAAHNGPTLELRHQRRYLLLGQRRNAALAGDAMLARQRV